MKRATELKLSEECTLHNAKKCREWIKEMRKNPLEVEDKVFRMIHGVCSDDDTGEMIVKEITVYTPYSAVIYVVMQCYKKFTEVCVSFKRQNLDEWNDWEKEEYAPIIKTYSLDKGDK